MYFIRFKKNPTTIIKSYFISIYCTEVYLSPGRTSETHFLAECKNDQGNIKFHSVIFMSNPNTKCSSTVAASTKVLNEYPCAL